MPFVSHLATSLSVRGLLAVGVVDGEVRFRMRAGVFTWFAVLRGHGSDRTRPDQSEKDQS